MIDLNIKVSPNKPVIVDTITRTVNMIVEDYTKRFGPIKKEISLEVQITPSPYFYDDGKLYNGCIASYDDICIISLVDPNNALTPEEWGVALCHEIVHYCQRLTNRHQKRNKNEDPFFSPREIEARGLENYYSDMYIELICERTGYEFGEKLKKQGKI